MRLSLGKVAVVGLFLVSMMGMGAAAEWDYTGETSSVEDIQNTAVADAIYDPETGEFYIGTNTDEVWHYNPDGTIKEKISMSYLGVASTRGLTRIDNTAYVGNGGIFYECPDLNFDNCSQILDISNKDSYEGGGLGWDGKYLNWVGKNNVFQFYPNGTFFREIPTPNAEGDGFGEYGPVASFKGSNYYSSRSKDWSVVREYDRDWNLVSTIDTQSSAPTAILKHFGENEWRVADESDSSPFTYYHHEGDFNQIPEFNSSNVDPDPPLIGKNVSYGVEASDPDGTVSTMELTVFDDGNQVYQDTQSFSSSSVDYSWSDVYEASQGELDARFTVTDDAGATSTQWLNRTLVNNPPDVTVNKPGNTTFWSYNNSYEVQVDTTQDSKPGESFSCDLYSGGDLVDTVSGTGQEIKTGNFRQDLGNSIEFKASCSDTGGTTNKSQFYTVEDFEINSGQIYSDPTTYETFNETFESSLYQGSMINSVDYSLIWDGEVVNQASQSFSDEGTLIQDLDHTIPLVSSNASSKSWKWNFTVDRTDFDGSTEQETFSTADQSQDVFWSYFISDSQALNDQDPASSQVKVLEGLDTGQQVNVSRETSSASLSGVLNFSRNSGTVDLERVSESSDKVVFEAYDYSGRVSQSSRTDYVNSSITVSFQGDTRELEASDTVETHKIVFDQGSSGTTDALSFEVLQENDFSNVLESDMDIAVSYWAQGSSQRVVREFSTSSDNKTTHSFQINPSWAELVVDSSEKLIQYQDSAGDYRLRSYFLLEETISSDVTEIDLYALKKTASSRIGIETVDGDGSALSEVIVRAERYFPAQDKSISVVMARTGSDGRAESFFEVNEIYYGFKFYRKDESGSYQLVDEKPQQIISQDLLRFTVSDVEQIGYYDFKSGIGHSCEYNATQVRCSYSSEEAIDVVELEVEELGAVGAETICLRKSSTASGKLICDGLNASETDFSYTLRATSGDGDQITLETGRSGETQNNYGQAGLLISFFLFATLSLGALAGPRPLPEIGVLLSTVALVVTYSAGLLAITYQAATTFVILAAITIYKMRRSTGGVGL